MLRVLIYSFPAWPLASLYFGVYVLLAEFYSSKFLLPLAALGLIFIFVRLFDAFSDPAMGYLSDVLVTRFGRRKPWVLLGGMIFIFSCWMLFLPDLESTINISYFAFWLIVSAIGWTIAYTPYYALGAELSTDYSNKNLITFGREFFSLVGIMTASLLYSVGIYKNKNEFLITINPSDGLKQIFLTSAVLFVISMVFFLIYLSHKQREGFSEKASIKLFVFLSHIKKNKLAKRLLVSQFVNGLANGFPPALFVFFVGSVLDLASYTGLLLLLYFLGSILGVPFWLFVSKRYDKHKVWCIAMLYACTIFSFVFSLDKGDTFLFSVICVLSGLALSADLALPASIQGDLVDAEYLRTGERSTGQFFALWAFVSKAALAISTGLALVVLDVIGFKPNTINEPKVLLILVIMYGGLPIILKLISVYIMWNFDLNRIKHKEIIKALRTKGWL